MSMKHIEVTAEAVRRLLALGAEGYFWPTVKSAPDHDYMIIDMEFIREIPCDVDAREVAKILSPFAKVKPKKLLANDVIHLRWEREFGRTSE